MREKALSILWISSIPIIAEGSFFIHPTKPLQTLEALDSNHVFLHLSCFYMYQDKKKLVFAPRFWGKILANFTYFVLYIHTNICIKITEVNNNTFLFDLAILNSKHIWYNVFTNELNFWQQNTQKSESCNSRFFVVLGTIWLADCLNYCLSNHLQK